MDRISAILNGCGAREYPGMTILELAQENWVNISISCRDSTVSSQAPPELA
jgi:hypothetical protein